MFSDLEKRYTIIQTAKEQATELTEEEIVFITEEINKPDKVMKVLDLTVNKFPLPTKDMSYLELKDIENQWRNIARDYLIGSVMYQLVHDFDILKDKKYESIAKGIRLVYDCKQTDEGRLPIYSIEVKQKTVLRATMPENVHWILVGNWIEDFKEFYETERIKFITNKYLHNSKHKTDYYEKMTRFLSV